MSSHRRDPYLWLHLAGLATVPLWLDVCLAGLAVGEPIVPPWLELATLMLIGTLPIVWLQLRRPVYIFGVPGLALRPDRLSAQRRRLLAIQRGWWSRGLVILTAIALGTMLYLLYQMAPMAIDLPGLASQSRTTGWAVCAGAFGLANLFALVPATVVPLLLTSPRQLEKTTPVEATQVLSRFWVVGLRLSRILPEVPQAEEISASESVTPALATVNCCPDSASSSLPDTGVVMAEAQSDQPKQIEFAASEPSVPEGPATIHPAVTEPGDKIADDPAVDDDNSRLSAPSLAESPTPSEVSATRGMAASGDNVVAAGGREQIASVESFSHTTDGASLTSAADLSTTTAAIAHSSTSQDSAPVAIASPLEMAQPNLSPQAIDQSHIDTDIAEGSAEAMDESQLTPPPAEANDASDSINSLYSVQSGQDPS